MIDAQYDGLVECGACYLPMLHAGSEHRKGKGTGEWRDLWWLYYECPQCHVKVRINEHGVKEL